LYVCIAKNIKLIIPTLFFLIFAVFILKYTTIGQGNNMIRRMRSAMNPTEDASFGVRQINQQAIQKYLKTAPWGIGIGMRTGQVPQNNYYYFLSVVPPDSSLVYTWIHSGIIGLIIYLMVLVLILTGGCYIVFFKLKDPMIRGIGSAFCCGMGGMLVSAYGNQVFTQYPNTLIFFGSMTIVYLLPDIEKKYLNDLSVKTKNKLENIKKANGMLS